MIDFRQGAYQQTLADVGQVDLVLADPPYGKKTHDGHDSAARQILSATGQKTRNNLSYKAWSPDDVREFVASWAPRCRGWMACMTSDDLIPVWRQAYRDAGRLDFPPVGVLIYHPRLLGDGPGSGVIYLMVSRPRGREFMGGWSLPPWYGPFYPAAERDMHIGGKPGTLMRSLVSDYSRVGDTVCDPTAGRATTLIAAHSLGRHGIGSEVDEKTYNLGKERIDRTLQQGDLFDPGTVARSLQTILAL